MTFNLNLFSFRVSVPETWTRYTEENIRRALSEISQSDELLNQSNQLMATTNNDMWSQWNHVNVSLENRVQEEQVAKNKIQAHLEKVLQEIFDVEQNIEFLKKTIADKEAFLQVAQTRLETRTRRPNVEACRDPAMHRFETMKTKTEMFVEIVFLLLDLFKKFTIYIRPSLIFTANYVKKKMQFNIYYEQNQH